MSANHVPVLLDTALACLHPVDGEIIVDATFGAGGYAAGLLDTASCRVIALDRDPVAVREGHRLARRYGGRLTVFERRFSELDLLVRDEVGGPVDGAVFDLGVSSTQIDDAGRGFSFRLDGPLDMRMGTTGPTAADAVNTLDEDGLHRIIGEFGEERRARAVARAIVRARATSPITRTGELADIVRRTVRQPPGGIDPATRTFQGLRIWVNQELQEIEEGLLAAEAVLREGGRLVVVAFHSLEDRIVKRFLRQRSGRGARPGRHQPPAGEAPEPTFRLVTTRPVRPSTAETGANPRARSARLRHAVRTSAPSWGMAA